MLPVGSSAPLAAAEFPTGIQCSKQWRTWCWCLECSSWAVPQFQNPAWPCVYKGLYLELWMQKMELIMHLETGDGTNQENKALEFLYPPEPWEGITVLQLRLAFLSIQSMFWIRHFCSRGCCSFLLALLIPCVWLSQSFLPSFISCPGHFAFPGCFKCLSFLFSNL